MLHVLIWKVNLQGNLTSNLTDLISTTILIICFYVMIWIKLKALSPVRHKSHTLANQSVFLHCQVHVTRRIGPYHVRRSLQLEAPSHSHHTQWNQTHTAQYVLDLCVMLDFSLLLCLREIFDNWLHFIHSAL